MVRSLQSTWHLDERGSRTVVSLTIAVDTGSIADAGMSVDVASPKGGVIPVDPQSLRSPLHTEACDRFLADEELKAKVLESLAVVPPPRPVRHRDRGRPDLDLEHAIGLRQPHYLCALGRIRTCDARFRKPTLYPLSYEGGVCAKCSAEYGAELSAELETGVQSDCGLWGRLCWVSGLILGCFRPRSSVSGAVAAAVAVRRGRGAVRRFRCGDRWCVWRGRAWLGRAGEAGSRVPGSGCCRGIW